jgi:hypothetical protein
VRSIYDLGVFVPCTIGSPPGALTAALLFCGAGDDAEACWPIGAVVGAGVPVFVFVGADRL